VFHNPVNPHFAVAALKAGWGLTDWPRDLQSCICLKTAQHGCAGPGRVLTKIAPTLEKLIKCAFCYRLTSSEVTELIANNNCVNCEAPHRQSNIIR